MKIKLYSFFTGLFFALSLSIEGEVWTDCSEAFEIAAQTVTLPSPAEIDYKVGLGKEFREALGDRSDINWNAVADNYREWSEHTTTLSGPARMLVACVLTAVTNGLGSEWLAAHGIAEGTATHAALSAGIQAVVVGAGTSFAGNLGDIGKTFDELTSADFVKSLASTMLTAGLNLGEAATLKEGALKGAEKIAIQTTLEGRKVGDILVGNVVDAGSAQLAHTIGDAKAGGTLNPVAHKALHAGLGAASAAITGGDALAGAIGAVVSETAAEALHKEGKDPATTAAQARIIGDTVAFLAGRDVASADSAGRMAVENNYLGHSLGLQFARQEIVNDESLSDAEKRQQLAEVDELAQQTVLAAGKGAALGLVGTAAVAAAPAINTAGLATSAYLMSNPTGMKVASLVTKGAVGLGTGILAYDYGKTAVNRGFGAAFARMQEDAGLMMSVPSEVFANVTKSAFSSAPQETKAIKTLVQDGRSIVTEAAANRAVITPPKPQQLEFGFVQEGKVGDTVAREMAAASPIEKSVASQSLLPLDIEPSSKFRLVHEIPAEGPASQFTSKTLSREVEWTAPTGTQQTYHVYQRNDIDWYRVRTNPKARFYGRTNIEAAKKGYAPEMTDGSSLNLHHIGQDSRGPLVEVLSTSHKKYNKQLHQQFGYQKQNPEHPVDRATFDQERSKYWIDRAMEVENGQK